MTQRDLAGVRAWYRSNTVWPQDIGFDPDGMCQKICRTAPNIGPLFASAFAQQQGTPMADRVHRISDIRAGMIGLFDDPNDSNPFGHVVTFMGRDLDADPDSLSSLFTRTNSVKSNQIVVVRADYFGRFWGDSFQFASKSINGVQLDIAGEKKPPPRPPIGPKGIARLQRIVSVYTDMIRTHEELDHPRVVRALRRDRAKVQETIARFKSLGRR